MALKSILPITGIIFLKNLVAKDSNYEKVNVKIVKKAPDLLTKPGYG
jgi:hypothetical protein